MLPVEQPRRKKKEEGLTNRRMNAIKHHHPAAFKDAFGNAKLGRLRHLVTESHSVDVAFKGSCSPLDHSSINSIHIPND